LEEELTSHGRCWQRSSGGVVVGSTAEVVPVLAEEVWLDRRVKSQSFQLLQLFLVQVKWAPLTLGHLISVDEPWLHKPIQAPRFHIAKSPSK
jgi:hypothetical protein